MQAEQSVAEVQIEQLLFEQGVQILKEFSGEM